MDPLKRLLPSRLVAARRHLGLSQQRLAREAAVAVSTVNAIESGLGDFRVSTLVKLCGVLGVSPGWLLGWDEGKTAPTCAVIEIGVVRQNAAVEIVLTAQLVGAAASLAVAANPEEFPSQRQRNQTREEAAEVGIRRTGEPLAR